MHLPDPIFPPLLSGHPVKAPKRAFEAAVEGAARGEFGAGDLVWARNTQRLECALVLEPEVPPESAVEMVPVAQVAFGDSFGALSPPELPLTFVWPTTIMLNGARVGEVRAAMSAARDDAGAPRFMVVGLEVAMRAAGRQVAEPGLTPDVTNLEEEGCGDITRTQLLESFARHFLAWVHNWEEEGFREVHDALLYRLDGHLESVAVDLGGVRHEGRFTGLDEHGNMLLDAPDGPRLLEVMSAIEIVESVEAAP